VGMMVLAMALFSFASLTPGDTALSIALRLALAGIGAAIFMPPNSSAAMNAVSANRRGIAAGTVATARNLGMVLGVAQTGAIFNSLFYTLSGGLTLQVYRPGLASIFMSSFRYAMAAGGVVAIIGAVLAFFRGSEKRGL